MHTSDMFMVIIIKKNGFVSFLGYVLCMQAEFLPDIKGAMATQRGSMPSCSFVGSVYL